MKLHTDSNRVVVDSSVFIALYHKEDPQYQRAINVFNDIGNKTIIAHPYVIQETVTVLAYKLGLSVVKKFVSRMYHSTNLFIPVVDIKKDLNSYTIAKKKLSFADICIIQLAYDLDVSLITFDKKMLATWEKKLSARFRF